MDPEDKRIEAKLLGEEVKRRYQLLRMARGGWNCWTGSEIALYICGIIMMASIIFREKNVDSLGLFIVFLTMIAVGSSLTGRRINALIELLGDNELLKVKK